MARTARTPKNGESIVFVQRGQKRRVRLSVPRAVVRDGRSMVPLADLWVASMPEDDLLELRFGVVTFDDEGEMRRSVSIDPLEFAQGFVDLKARTLWWEDPAASWLHGLPAQTLFVVRSAPSRLAKTTPAPASRAGASMSVVQLRRLLPAMVRQYPAIEWRRAAGDGIATSQDG
jgi:hypothetical protein